MQVAYYSTYVLLLVRGSHALRTQRRRAQTETRRPGWENFETLTRGPEEPLGPGPPGPGGIDPRVPGHLYGKCMGNDWGRHDHCGAQLSGEMTAMMALRRPALAGAGMITNTRWPACRAGLCACSAARAQVGDRGLV